MLLTWQSAHRDRLLLQFLLPPGVGGGRPQFPQYATVSYLRGDQTVGSVAARDGTYPEVKGVVAITRTVFLPQAEFIGAILFTEVAEI